MHIIPLSQNWPGDTRKHLRILFVHRAVALDDKRTFSILTLSGVVCPFIYSTLEDAEQVRAGLNTHAC